MSKPLLFNYFRSTCAWRVRNALELKGIEFEVKTVNILKGEQLEGDYLKTNPMKQVPALVVDGKTLTQSLSIMEFLEEKYPEKPLLPKDLFLRSKVREIANIITSGIQPLQNLDILIRMGDKKVEWAHDMIHKGFVALEQVLKDSAGTYSVGDIVTMADCCLVPQVYNAQRFKVDMSLFPTIMKVNDNLMKLEAFKVAHYTKQPDCPEDLK